MKLTGPEKLVWAAAFAKHGDPYEAFGMVLRLRGGGSWTMSARTEREVEAMRQAFLDESSGPEDCPTPGCMAMAVKDGRCLGCGCVRADHHKT